MDIVQFLEDLSTYQENFLLRQKVHDFASKHNIPMRTLDKILNNTGGTYTKELEETLDQIRGLVS